MNLPTSAVLWLLRNLTPAKRAQFETFMYEYDEEWAQRRLKEGKALL